MKLLSTTVFAIVSLAGAACHAQFVSVYGTYTAMHVSGVEVSSSGESAGAWGSNLGGGVTVNMLNLPVVKVGIDARGGGGVGTHKMDSAELSLRFGIQPPVLRVKPFVQLGVGYAAPTVSISSGVASTTQRKYVTVGGHAGLDEPLIPFLDWRVVDVGYAHGYDVGTSFSGRNPGANFFSVGTGLVAHF